MDEVAQLPVVSLNRTLAAAHPLALEPKHPVVERHLAMSREIIWPTRILGNEYTDDSERAGEADGSHQVVQRRVGMFMTLRVMRLITDTLTTAVGPLSLRQLEHLVHRRDLGVVDWNTADLAGQTEAIRMPVHDHHHPRVLDRRRECGHQPYWAGAVNHHRVPGPDV